uniref:Uncharacterized protein n=1 Tax=viral metagenome TaxID=1070528 RepID=A0A6C0LXE3_9ZZZZ
MNNDRDLLLLLNRVATMVLIGELSEDEKARVHGLLIGVIPTNDDVDMMRYAMLGFYTSQLMQS